MFSRRNYEGLIDAAHRNSEPPLTSGANIGDLLGAMDKVQAHGEDTQTSGSGSGFSDLSLLENETDDFGRRLLQHQRDTKRLKAIRGNQQAFRKAIPRPRIADVLNREDRERRQGEEEDKRREDNTGSSTSDPPVNIPRAWGRKARKQPHWMRKIVEPSENGDAEEGSEEGAPFRGMTGLTGDENWRGPDVPVPSVERTPPRARRELEGPVTPPSSMRHMNTTLRSAAPTDDQDFSSVSLLTSTPAHSRIPRRIDVLARQEVQSLEQQGLTSKTLSQMNERPATNATRATHAENRPGTSFDSLGSGLSPTKKRLTAATSDTANILRRPRRRRSPGHNGENIPPQEERYDDARRTNADQLKKHRLQAQIGRDTKRPNHRREDSMDLLRKLARVSSKSPSPAAGKPKDVLQDDGNAGRKVDVCNDELRGGQKDYVSAEGPHVSTPVPQDDAQNAKTPIVTGAWIDTTMHADDEEGTDRPSSRDQLPVAAPADQSGQVEKLKKAEALPGRPPKSALSAILGMNKKVRQEVDIANQPVQDNAHPEQNAADPTITFDIESEDAIKDEDPDVHLTQAERDRRQESLAMEGLDKHLRAARTGIKDVSKGLRRVEHTIVNVEDTTLPILPPTVEATTSNPKPNAFSFIHCEACGGCYHSVWLALWSEICSCFYSWSPQRKYKLRPTPFGFLCAISLLWYLVESLLCTVYCKPLYTTRAFYDIDSRAPRYPFVIPTLLFRPFLMWALGERGYDLMWDGLEAWWHKEVFERFITGGDPCWNMRPAVCRRVDDSTISLHKTTIRQAFDTVISTTRGSEWVAGATATAARIVSSFGDALDEAGSMWDDDMVL